MGRFREWQKRHDSNLTRRYGRLPGPLQAVTGLYPSQQRVKQRARAESDETENVEPTPPPPGWYADPHGPGQRWWDGTRWTEHAQ